MILYTILLKICFLLYTLLLYIYKYYFIILKILHIILRTLLEHSSLKSAQNLRTLKACPKNDVLIKRKECIFMKKKILIFKKQQQWLKI